MLIKSGNSNSTIAMKNSKSDNCFKSVEAYIQPPQKQLPENIARALYDK